VQDVWPWIHKKTVWIVHNASKPSIAFTVQMQQRTAFVPIMVEFEINDLYMKILAHRLQKSQMNRIVRKEINQLTIQLFWSAEAQTIDQRCPTRYTLNKMDF